MVTVRIPGADAKRIHAALELLRAGHSGVAASAEAMLLHVRSRVSRCSVRPFLPHRRSHRGNCRRRARACSRMPPAHGGCSCPHPRGPHEGTLPAAPARTAQHRTDRRAPGRIRRRLPAASSATQARCGAYIPAAVIPGAAVFSIGRGVAGGAGCGVHRRPNHEVPAIAAALARRGAGGFVCFAAGFSENRLGRRRAPHARAAR